MAYLCVNFRCSTRAELRRSPARDASKQFGRRTRCCVGLNVSPWRRQCSATSLRMYDLVAPVSRRARYRRPCRRTVDVWSGDLMYFVYWGVRLAGGWEAPPSPGLEAFPAGG